MAPAPARQAAIDSPGARCGNCGRDSAEGFAFCPHCGAPLEAAPAEARKTVTILFCDVTGSTSLGERLDPEWAAGRTEEAAVLVAEAIERYERKGNVVSAARTWERLAALGGA